MTSEPAPASLPEWRRSGGPPAASAILRSRPEDFRVSELLAIEFSGDGEHDWLLIEKRNANTAWVARQLARIAAVPPRDVGYAGLKDRHAVTRQWFSVRRARGATHDWRALDVEGAVLLRAERHQRKLRHGAHSGNRFELCLRDLRGDPRPALERLAAEGMPNYFGEQRFGHAGGNLALAADLFAGRRLRREQRSHALSAARAFLFNVFLDARVRAGTWNRLLAGDTAMLDGSNSHFALAEPDADIEARCADFDLHPSGPLWGRAAPAGERGLLEEHESLLVGLERHADAARRSLRVRPRELAWTVDGDTLELAFSLPPGSFATALLREVLDYTDRAAGGTDSAAS